VVLRHHNPFSVVYHNIAKPIISRGVKQDIKNNSVFGV
jgi:hypothetical protein